MQTVVNPANKIKIGVKPVLNASNQLISNPIKAELKCTISTNKKIIYDNDQTMINFGPLLKASYYPTYFHQDDLIKLLNQLQTVPFCRVQYNKYGKTMTTPRHTYCYGQFDNQSIVKYRGKTFTTEAIPEWLSLIKKGIENITQHEYNAIILNKYLDGNDHISWHADSEPFLKHQMIASITIGNERDFQFREDPKSNIHELRLKHGSLFVFDQGLLHCLPKRANCSNMRYNITFRCVKNSSGIGNYYYYNRGAELPIKSID